MEGETCPQFLDLIAKDREYWLNQRDDEQRSHRSSEEKKLELRLGPPGEDWTHGKDGGTTKSNFRDRDDSSSLLSLGYHPSNHNTNTVTSGAKRGFIDTFEREPNNGSSQTGHKFFNSENPVGGGGGGGTTLSSPSSPWSSIQNQQQTKAQHHLQFPSSSSAAAAATAKESSQHCCSKVVELQQHSAEKKKTITAVPNSPQKRTAAPPVVGWPPLRSFRKNLANTSSSKPPPQVENEVPKKFDSEKQIESSRKGLFVKINMDGVPIGRKVDLKAYDSYEKLSSAVDELFRDLLAAQGNSFAGGIQLNKKEEEKAITGLLDGSGEYTLVYEDNEGDRVLVGDVPWHMFVSTVKRLRVLKSSELSSLSLGSRKQEKLPRDAALK